VLVVMGNQRLFGTLWTETGPGRLSTVLAVGIVMLAVYFVLLQVVALPWVLKPVATLLLLVTAVSAYFMDSFGVIIDEDMLRNVAQTDRREVLDLLSPAFVGYMVLAGLLPVTLLVALRVRYGPVREELPRRALLAGALTLAAALGAWSSYKDLSLTVRATQQLKHMLNPITPLAASLAYWRATADLPAGPPRPVAEDARRPEPVASGAPGRRRIVVFVLGETATAGHFSLNGYARDTNPRLALTDVVSFPRVHSCGTSTAASVPCMFSAEPKADYTPKSAEASENVLDVLMRVGVDVFWRENNSGCKGVCDRVPSEDVGNGLAAPGEETFDEALLVGLQQHFDSHPGDLFVVLHQRGSHGPAYSHRTPPAFKRFLPECTRTDIQACSRDDLVNAYDNTILYTDHVLAELILLLEANRPEADVAMLYVSDHGESLGENGLYLHGLPDWLAPEEQTHVPMLFWAAPEFYASYRLDRELLDGARGAAYSHDHLFHTLLGFFDVETAVYEPGLDVFAPCRKP
jgi:lipid A ethanolaminephosphotransferase